MALTTRSGAEIRSRFSVRGMGRMCLRRCMIFPWIMSWRRRLIRLGRWVRLRALLHRPMVGCSDLGDDKWAGNASYGGLARGFQQTTTAHMYVRILTLKLWDLQFAVYTFSSPCSPNTVTGKMAGTPST